MHVLLLGLLPLENEMATITVLAAAGFLIGRALDATLLQTLPVGPIDEDTNKGPQGPAESSESCNSSSMRTYETVKHDELSTVS